MLKKSATWLLADRVAADAMVPPNLVGLFASVIGMLLGSLAPTLVRNQGRSIEAAIHHGATQQPGHAGGHHGHAAKSASHQPRRH